MNFETMDKIKITPRVQRLRDMLFDKMPQIEGDRARLITESYKMTEHLPVIKRRSAAFSHILKNIPITIREGEPIVKQLPSNAQFHIIEFKQGDIPNGPPESAKIAPEKLKEIATKSGLELDHEVENLLPYQIYYIFKKQ